MCLKSPLPAAVWCIPVETYLMGGVAVQNLSGSYLELTTRRILERPDPNHNPTFHVVFTLWSRRSLLQYKLWAFRRA